jgi:excisionase family DNA binding protein
VPPFVDTQTPNPLVLSLPDELVEAVAQRAAEIVLTAQSEPADEWLDVAGAAEYLKCGKRRVYNLVSEGRAPVHREGTRLLFKRLELDAWIESGRATVAKPC